MIETKQHTISRLRGLVKGVKQDAFLTDRFLYSLAWKYAALFIRRMDERNQLAKYQSIFQTVPGVRLEEVSTIEAGCADIDVCCTIKRTPDLPDIVNGSRGPIIWWVTSLDESRDVRIVDPKTYLKMTKTASFKYNKTLYAWYRDNRLYFPNLEWTMIDIRAMWKDGVSGIGCDPDDCCIDHQSMPSNIPDHLFAEIENGVRQELMGMMQVPKDNLVDNQSILRS